MKLFISMSIVLCTSSLTGGKMHETDYVAEDLVPTQLLTNPGHLSSQNHSSKVNPHSVLVFSTIMCLTVVLCGMTTPLLVIGIKSHQKPLECSEAACPENWIGFQRKCFYFSDDIMNWTFSKRFCESQDADLVHVETLQELNFLLRYKDLSDYWIGLSREQGQPWKWTNGTEWTTSFPIKGRGDYAYLNDKGASSGRSYTEKKWICSKLDTYAQMKGQSPS